MTSEVRYGVRNRIQTSHNSMSDLDTHALDRILVKGCWHSTCLCQLLSDITLYSNHTIWTSSVKSEQQKLTTFWTIGLLTSFGRRDFAAESAKPGQLQTNLRQTNQPMNALIGSFLTRREVLTEYTTSHNT